MEGKPEQVRKAQLVGDHDALSRMGQKGSRQAQLNRIVREKVREAIIKDGIKQNQLEANEHIVDPDI